MKIVLSIALFVITVNVVCQYTVKEYDLRGVDATPVLDGYADPVYNLAATGMLDRWDVEEYDPVDGNFRAIFTNDAVYVHVAIKDPDLMDEDDFGFALDIGENRGEYGWESEPKDGNGFFYTKIMGSDLGLNTLVNTRRTDYFVVKTDTGFIWEAKLRWSEVTTDTSKLSAMWERGDIYFDVNFKDNGHADRYVAWCNDDHSSWKNSYRMGVASLIPYSLEGDASLMSLSLSGGQTLEPPFNPYIFEYELSGGTDPEGDEIIANPKNPDANVEIQAFEAGNHLATVRITSEDESQVLQYTIDRSTITSEAAVLSSFTAIYPNPAGALVRIRTTGNIKHVSLWSLSGKLIKQQQCKQTSDVTMNLADVQTGCYFVNILMVNGEHEIRKLIKN